MRSFARHQRILHRRSSTAHSNDDPVHPLPGSRNVVSMRGEDHRGDHGVEPICRVLPIAPATFYDHLAKRANPLRLSDRAKRDEELKPEIERVFEANLSVYGVRKIWHQMRREGFDVSRCTVARLMKDIGIEGVIRGKKPRTTIPDKALPCPLDRGNRKFHAPAPNVLWVSDFTYVATWQGFVYVAFVIDVFARRIVGWRASRTANAGFVLDALEQAFAVAVSEANNFFPAPFVSANEHQNTLLFLSHSRSEIHPVRPGVDEPSSAEAAPLPAIIFIPPIRLLGSMLCMRLSGET